MQGFANLHRNPDPVATLRAWFHDRDSKGWVIVQAVMGVLVLVSILLLAAELIWEDEGYFFAEIELIDELILWVFVFELLLRVATYKPPETEFYVASPWMRLRWEVLGRIRFLLQPLNLADALAVLAVIPALRGLRALRLLRLLRGLRVFRYTNPVTGFARAFEENRLPFMMALAFLILTIVMFGTTIYMVEHRENPAVSTLADGYWWAIVTITTVGFGDIAPVTAIGRTVAAVLMVIGMFTLALFAGIVGHTMLSVVLTIRQEEFRMSGYVNHLIVCGYDPAGRRLLDELIGEVGGKYEGRMAVFARGERPSDLPSEFSWIEGDPTKESELEKVRMGQAAVAIIVGSRASTPQQADAVTILTAFTIRKMLRRVKGPARRARPLYIIAEILDSENVEHARTAGCDEVIETTRLGFSLVAHATSMPGTAAIISEVASRGAQSLYVGTALLGGESVTFVELASRLKQSHGVLLVGVRDPKSHDDIVNPASDFVVRDGAEMLYFAERPELPFYDGCGPGAG